MFLASKKLASIYDNSFYIEMQHYLELFSIHTKPSRANEARFSFQEQ